MGSAVGIDGAVWTAAIGVDALALMEVSYNQAEMNVPVKRMARPSAARLQSEDAERVCGRAVGAP